MTVLTIQLVCLVVVIVLTILAHTGKEPVKRPLLWPGLIIANVVLCLIAGAPYIHAFAVEHPWIFWGYIVPLVLILAGGIVEGLKDHFAWMVPTIVMALIPGLNLALIVAGIGMVCYTVITDPKYCWRGLKNRFNFSKD